METLEKHVRWQVSLSNGETLYEGKGGYKTIEGGLSPYQRLLEYLSANDLKITSMSLYTDSDQHFNLPSSGNNPKFSEFGQLSKPGNYKMFRKVGFDISAGNKENVEEYSVIEAIYPEYKLQLWVDENNVKNCWVLIR